MKFANQAALTALTLGTTQALTIVSGLVMPRIIAPDVKGPCSLVMNLSTPLIVFSNLGLATALLYHPGRKTIPLDRIASTALTTALILGSLAAGICAFFLPGYFAEERGQVIETWHVALVLAVCPLQLATSYLNSTQLVAGRIVGFNVVQALPVYIFYATFFGLYFALGPARFVRSPPLFLTVMVVARVAQWVGGSLTAVGMLRNVATFRPQIDFGFLREAMRFGFRPYLRDIFQVGTLSFTLYFLNANGFGRAEIGYYDLAWTAMVALWQVPEVLHMVIANRMATQSAQDRQWFTPLVCRNVLLVTAIAALAVVLGCEILVRTWWSGKGWEASLPAIRILAAGSVLYSIFKVLQTDLLGRGKIDLVPALAGLTFFVLVALSVTAISILEWRSIAVASACCAIAMATTALVTLICYCRISGNGMTQVLFPGLADAKLWFEMFRVMLRLR